MDIRSMWNSLIEQQLDAIQGLIDSEIRESQVLEYKRALQPFQNDAKNEIAKDVSAFANSSGGVILYGVDTDPQDKTKPISISGIHEKNIETFDRVVNSRIRKEIKGLKKEIIIKNGVTCMAVYVPQSIDSPHQSLPECVYYRRALTESKPMEHDLIELHFGKRFGPILDLVGEFTDGTGLESQSQTLETDGFSSLLTIRLMIVNTGKKVGRYCTAILIFPDAATVSIVSADRLINIDSLHPGYQARQFEENVGVFHPDMRRSVASLQVRLSATFLNDCMQLSSKPLISWTLFADEMSKRTGTLSITLPPNKGILQLTPNSI